MTHEHITIINGLIQDMSLLSMKMQLTPLEQAEHLKKMMSLFAHYTGRHVCFFENVNTDGWEANHMFRDGRYDYKHKIFLHSKGDLSSVNVSPEDGKEYWSTLYPQLVTAISWNRGEEDAEEACDRVENIEIHTIDYSGKCRIFKSSCNFVSKDGHLLCAQFPAEKMAAIIRDQILGREKMLDFAE